MKKCGCLRLLVLLVLALGAAVSAGSQAAAAGIHITPAPGANARPCSVGPQLASAEASRQIERHPGDATRHRRSLLAATQQISQCDWILGEGCALHPAYASYALNKSSDDVVAQYVSNSLACATATDKGLCESASFCYWDPSFSNGQQGCFLQDDAMLSLQLRCVQQQHLSSLTKLQACMAARASCQCASSVASASSSAATCNQRQAQLLTSFPGASRDKVCGSLLGCWLSSLNSTSTDLTQLVEVQLTVVQPTIEALGSGSGDDTSSSSASAGGRRRRALLQIPPSLSDPVFDDKSGSAAGGDGYVPEAGSYGPGSSSSTGSAGAPAVGMNGVVTEDQAVDPVSSNAPVENGNNVPAPGKTSGGSGSSANGSLQLESGAVGADWVLEQAPVDPDKVFGSSPAAGSSPSSGGSGSGSSGGEVQMTGGNAPASFWQCAADAAAKADTTRKWADIDYNSKSLTLAIWLKVIQPTSLIDWGVQVMECFKTEVPKLTNLDVSTNSTKPNKESLEFAIVSLIRTFSGQAEAFRSYLQAAPAARGAAGQAALSRLVNEVYPGQLAALAAKQQASPAYRHDVMLQAAAIITDLQWLAADVLALTSGANSTGQQEALEGYITFAEESIRRSLYWLFYLQFDGPPAHLPGTIPSSAASTAVISAFEDLAAAALPSRIVAADAPAWQQLQVMTATAAGSAAAAAAQFGSELDGSLVLSNAVAGLAKAHVQDLWGSRLELARNGASPAGRQLALRDPNEKSARWEQLRRQQVSMLVALQQLAAADRPGADGGAANQRLAVSLRELVAASGAYLLTTDDAAVQQQKQQELSSTLGLSARLAHLIRQCHGSPAGLPALTPAAAAKAGVPAATAAACAELSTHTSKLSAAGADGIIRSTLSAALDRQWRCNAVPAEACNSKPGCALALAPVLVPTPAAAGADNLTLSCQASDASLFLSSLDSSAKSSLAVSQVCDQFLKLPACEATSSAVTCSSSPSCRWEPSAQRNILHTASASPNVGTAAAGAGSSGVCTMDWVALLAGSGGGSAYSGLSSMIQLCQGIADPGQCESQTMLITLDAPAPGGSSMARFWVPALVVAAVAGVLLFGAAIWWRRHSAAARRAADEARAAAGGGRGGRKGGKDGKGGKGAKGATKKKPKRAEPGSYKPDLMRDSFTDYMRAAPQQFSNGVAIAKAAIATGGLDTAVAVADVAGGRQLESHRSEGPQQQQQPPYGSRGLGRTPSPGSDGSWGLAVGPAGSVPRSQGSSDLIDLGQSDASGHNSNSLHGEQPGLAPYSSSLSGGPAGGGSAGPGGAAVWGLAATSVGLAGSPGLVSPRGFGFGGQPQGATGRLPLHGDMSVPVNLLDANASIALASSINLVSSLPHHSSLPIPGLMSDGQQQQQMGLLQRDVQMGLMQQQPAGGAARANFGAPSSLARISGNSSTVYAGRSGSTFDNAHSGSLLLPAAASRGAPGPAAAASEDGCTTPTSSCCHDSVCTFGPEPGSVVSAAGSAGSGRPSGVGVRPAQATGQRGQAGVVLGLAAAPSVPLSRSSWSSAISTDLLMSTQHSSAIVDP